MILQKELYINDVHHKIKNNLQTIVAILDMQLAEKQADLQLMNEHDKKCFDKWQGFVIDVERRIVAISLVHSMLNKSNFESHTANINFSVYIYNLLEQISELFSVDKKRIRCVYEGKDYLIDSDRAVTSGLIINEILSNFYKFCLDNNVLNPSIKIKMSYADKKGSKIKLQIDKLHKSKDKYAVARESMTLITGMIKQIDATLSIKSTKEKSTFIIMFNNK